MLVIVRKGKNLLRRFYANFFDYFIVVAATGLFIRFAGTETENGYHVGGPEWFVIPFFWWIYFPLCEGLFGQTIGKKALNLVVVDLQGGSPSIVHTTLRRLLDPVEFLSFGIGAMLVINYSPNNQRIGDHIAQTTVVRLDAVCRQCDARLELSPREALAGTFTCPNCNALN